MLLLRMSVSEAVVSVAVSTGHAGRGSQPEWSELQMSTRPQQIPGELSVQSTRNFIQTEKYCMSKYTALGSHYGESDSF